MNSSLKYCLTLVIPVLLWSPGYGQIKEPIQLDLKQSLNLALENNIKLKTAQLDKDKAAIQLNQAEAAFYPQLSAITSYQDYLKLPTQLIPGEFFGMPGELIPIQFGTQHNLSASVDASMVLYNQPLLLSYQMTRKAIEISKLSFDKSKEEVIFETAQVYYTAQAFSNQSLTLEQNISKLQKLTSLMQEQYNNGFVRKVDLDKVKVNISNLQTQLDNFRDAIHQQLALLKYMTGLPQNTEIELHSTLEYGILEDAPKLIPDEYTDYQQLQKMEEMAGLKIRESKAAYLPSLTAIGQYSFQSQKNDFTSLYQKPDWLKMSFVGISLNIPLFSGFGNHYKVTQSKLEKKQISLQKDNLASYLEVQFNNAAAKLEVNRKAYDNQIENVKLAEEVYRVTQEQYEKGISPLAEVLDAETSLSTAQSALLQSRIQIRLTELDLLKSTGKLTSLINKTQ